MCSNSSSDIIMTLHLPTELLSKILKNLDDYTAAKTLYNFSLACRHFRSLAQPLIFRSFYLSCGVHPFPMNSTARESARLDFYSSDAIAPLVRELGILGDLDLVEVMQPEPANFSKIFDALPRFINIRLLVCCDINFTPFALHQVSKLPFLEYLISKNCSAPPKTDSLPMLRVPTFECIANPQDPVGVDQTLALLDPNHLHVLRAPPTEAFCSFFLTNDDPSPCLFPSLHTLDLYVWDETLPLLSSLPRLLPKTPALRILKIDLSSDSVITGLESPTTCPAPNLEEYRGPHKVLPMVLGRATGSSSAQLRCLFLRSVATSGDALGDFIHSLNLCHPPQLQAVTSLYISWLESMELKSLGKLRDMFPALQEFYLHASEELRPSVHAHNIDLTDLYTLPLPSTLESLSIQWTSDKDAGAVPDLVAAKDSLVPRLPNLRHLWLFDLSKLGLIWSRIGSRFEERWMLHEVGSRDDAWAMRQVVFPKRWL